MKRVALYMISLLLLCPAGPVSSQSFRLQQLQLNDSILVRRLTSFIQLTKAKWLFIRVAVDPTDQSATYSIRPIEEYEPVRNYRGRFWGEWHHTLLLVNSSSDSLVIGQVLNVVDLAHLRAYARIYLPRINVPVLGQKGYFEIHFHTTSSAFNQFKVVHGKEVYFRTTGGGYIDEPLVPDSLPPVPEHR